MRVALGIGIGFVLFTNSGARQITADALRAVAEALAPAESGKTLQDRSAMPWRATSDGQVTLVAGVSIFGGSNAADYEAAKRQQSTEPRRPRGYGLTC